MDKVIDYMKDTCQNHQQWWSLVRIFSFICFCIFYEFFFFLNQTTVHLSLKFKTRGQVRESLNFRSNWHFFRHSCSNQLKFILTQKGTHQLADFSIRTGWFPASKLWNFPFQVTLWGQRDALLFLFGLFFSQGQLQGEFGGKRSYRDHYFKWCALILRSQMTLPSCLCAFRLRREPQDYTQVPAINDTTEKWLLLVWANMHRICQKDSYTGCFSEWISCKSCHMKLM